MNNLAKNLTDRFGQPHVGKTISSSQFKENDLVNLSCDEHGFKSVYSVSTTHKTVTDLIDGFKKDTQEEYEMPWDVAIGMYPNHFENWSEYFRNKLLKEDKSCLEKQTNNQVNFDDKEQIYLCDGIVCFLVYRYVFFNEPLRIIGLASDELSRLRATLDKQLVN